MPDRVTAVVVSHTHWDREWYLPFQRFRIRLVELIDRLLDILDNEPGYQYFTLDGQTVILEDYLEIRPESRERLERHIRAGRILIGPWYVLPDEFLVSPESLVRNLLLGQLIAEPLGGAMPVGYLPDTFGHPAQMPQILRGFDLDSAVLYRGVHTDVSEFMWQAPDGSSVLAVYLPSGYCNAMQLTAAPRRFLERLPEIVDRVKAMTTNGTILLMNGCDHLLPRREIQAIIDEANRRLDNDVWLEQGTLTQYIKRVKAARPHLKTVMGEFRRPSPARVTPGVVSSRMYLKLENFKSFTLLEKYAEPLSALASILGHPYPRAFLWQAWRYLLQNHPHDSICGCSIDSVHQDMLARFRWSQEIALDLCYLGLDALASHVDAPITGDHAAFIVVNPLTHARGDYVSHYLDFFQPDTDFHIRDCRGEVVPHQVLRRKPQTMFYDPYLRRVELDGKQKPAAVAASKAEVQALVEAGVWRQWVGEEVEILVLPRRVPPGGHAALGVRLQPHDEMPQTDLRVGRDYLENGLLRVTVNDDGSLDILDKRTQTRYPSLNLLENRGDRGDEYNYCPLEQDEPGRCQGTTPTVDLVESGPIRATFEIRSEVVLPKGLTEDRRCRSRARVACPVATRVSLAAGSPRVEVSLSLTNLAEDNVLRVLFPTPIRTDFSHALGQFEVVSRPVSLPHDVPPTLGPDEEIAVTTFPHHAFVDVNDGTVGLAVLSRGLTEYEVIPGDAGVTVALTLIRSVGWLSRGDLSTRFGHAGPGLSTPDAQCLGSYTFEYAILPHPGTWTDAHIPAEANRYIVPAKCAAVRTFDGHLPPELSFIAIEPEDLVFSALKKAETDDDLILRLYNPTADAIQARLTLASLFNEVRLVNLGERELDVEPLVLDENNTFHLEVRPYKICSVKLRKR